MAVVKSILLQDANGAPIQLLPGSSVRANLTAGATTSSTTLPTNSAGAVVIVRSTDYVWLNFGTAGVTATAAATSILVAPGEGAYAVPSTATHFAGLRVGSTDVVVQLEAVATV